MLVKTAAASAKYPSIAIIGGGIGGLTAANAFLFRKNLVGRVSIYEQASHFIPTAGAGFGFSPNGQICLSSIGINGYHRVGHPFDRLVRIDKSGRLIQQESQVFRELRQRHGFGIYGCLRADIVELLVEGLNKQQEPVLNYNHKLTKITPIKDKVELEFNDGELQDVVDLVIGADGIHSTVAKQLNIDDEIPPLYSILVPISSMERFRSHRLSTIFKATPYLHHTRSSMALERENSLPLLLDPERHNNSFGPQHMRVHSHRNGKTKMSGTRLPSLPKNFCVKTFFPTIQVVIPFMTFMK
jgi:2-polyprenyl-6-methoxyphenol hydroxylase-like FAD-dependent oxidoreductase